MTLKPQDLLFLLKLVVQGEKPWSFNKLALELGMSPSEVHAAARRAVAAHLAVRTGDRIRPELRNLEEFLLHGVRYVFVPEFGGLTRGMATGAGAPPLAGRFGGEGEPPPVWPDAEGEVRGPSVSPLYKAAPHAAKRDPALYELLVLVDALRFGRARERDFAVKELQRRLSAPGSNKEPKMNTRDQLVIGKEIVVSRAALGALARRFHISRLALFGSAARGELRSDSDIDLLVEFEAGHAPSLGGMVDIQDAFAALFKGRKVDVATPAILNNPYRRRAIEKDMEELYAA